MVIEILSERKLHKYAGQCYPNVKSECVIINNFGILFYLFMSFYYFTNILKVMKIIVNLNV